MLDEWREEVSDGSSREDVLELLSLEVCEDSSSEVLSDDVSDGSVSLELLSSELVSEPLTSELTSEISLEVSLGSVSDETELSVASE